MIVVYCADKSIYHILPTTLNSLLSNNSNVEKVYLLIEDDSIDYITDSRITFINCNQFDFLIRSGFNVSLKFPYMAMTRCFLTKILDEDKVLYIDVDTIVDGDISELWNLNLSGSCIAGKYESWKVDYINSGVLIMDLKQIREQKLDEKVIRLLKSCKFAYPDQDAINFIFRGRILPIDEKFNMQGRDEVYNKKFLLRHFSGIAKPWFDNATKKDKALWNKYRVDKI